MRIARKKKTRLGDALGSEGFEFLCYALDGITRILPHIETSEWTIEEQAQTRVTWTSNDRREVRATVGLNLGEKGQYSLTATIHRKMAPSGVGRIRRTIDRREYDICDRVVRRVSEVLRGGKQVNGPASLRAVRHLFDEQIVASHVQSHHELELDLSSVFRALRNLAEQSYENKSLAFGCLIDPQSHDKPDGGELFPEDVLGWKRYRALTDGYRTAYRISTHGRIVKLEDLVSCVAKSAGEHFYPEWCEYLANASRAGVCGVCLTRQGDILVFDAGTLRFTYRFGTWQYWNHSHIIDLLKNRALAQRVPQTVIGKVVKSIYRTALDVSFRRTGGLFVLLHNRKSVSHMVLKGDAIGDTRRQKIHKGFDDALPARQIQLLPRRLMVELASLDGAVVLNNQGSIVAYGAVLNPQKKGKIGPAEGSRTKAAIGASKYGIAVKVSSDGDITFFENGKPFFSA